MKNRFFLSNKRNILPLFSLFWVIIILGIYFPFKRSLFAADGIYEAVNFQGKVVNADGTNVADGSYDFEFKLYNVGSGGTAAWTETWDSANCGQLDVADGTFQVELGSCTSFTNDFNQDSWYLGVNFNSDGEMAPRIRFTAVPYAMNAKKVAGLTVTNTTGTLTIPNGTTIAFSGENNLTMSTSGLTTATLPSGTVTLADLSSTQTLTNKTIGSSGLVFSGASTDITTGTNEDLVIDPNGTGGLVIGSSGNTFTFDPASGPTYAGNARITKKIVISPEYPGGTLTDFYGAGTDTSITGDMTADVEANATDEQRTYYQWSSSETGLNYYTVVTRITLPEDFDAWAATNAFQVDFTTESTVNTNNLLDVFIYLSSNTTTEVAKDDDDNAAASAEAWETITIDDSSLDSGTAPEWDAAGETANIYLRMGSTGSNFVRIGDIVLNYLAKF